MLFSAPLRRTAPTRGVSPRELLLPLAPPDRLDQLDDFGVVAVLEHRVGILQNLLHFGEHGGVLKAREHGGVGHHGRHVRHARRPTTAAAAGSTILAVLGAAPIALCARRGCRFGLCCGHARRARAEPLLSLEQLAHEPHVLAECRLRALEREACFREHGLDFGDLGSSMLVRFGRKLVPLDEELQPLEHILELLYVHALAGRVERWV
mmetsp:Transcript_791/g.3082  ORF Transcript_791/g.3082 Transcript_791/m.3082 type:complete len:208 (-) Transcript_791:184-807(-)